jgi:hypothetical protein
MCSMANKTNQPSNRQLAHGLHVDVAHTVESAHELARQTPLPPPIITILLGIDYVLVTIDEDTIAKAIITASKLKQRK